MADRYAPFTEVALDRDFLRYLHGILSMEKLLQGVELDPWVSITTSHDAVWGFGDVTLAIEWNEPVAAVRSYFDANGSEHPSWQRGTFYLSAGDSTRKLFAGCCPNTSARILLNGSGAPYLHNQLLDRVHQVVWKHETPEEGGDLVGR